MGTAVVTFQRTFIDDQRFRSQPTSGAFLILLDL